MASFLRNLFVFFISVTVILNLLSFIFSIVLLVSTHQFTSFVGDIKHNIMKSPLFDIFVSDNECKSSNTNYLLGYFEGTSSGCDCRYMSMITPDTRLGTFRE